MDIAELKRRFDSLGELPPEHRRQALLQLEPHINDVVGRMAGSKADATEVRRMYAVLLPISAAITKAKKKAAK